MRIPLDRHMPSPGVPELNRRLAWVVGTVALTFAVLAGRLWQLQVVKGDRYYQRSTNNFVKERWIPAVRGRIVDRHGAGLVDNRPAFNVYVTPRYFTAASSKNLVRLLGLTEDEARQLDSKVAQGRLRDRFASVLVLEDVSRDSLALIEQSRAELPGVEVQDVPHRHYLFDTLAAHVLGYMNQIGDAELEERRAEGYLAGDYVGRYGIERQWENYLRGKRGVERYVVDAKGHRLSDKEADELLTGERFVAPVPGHNLVLTLDAELERLAERALRNYPAGGIAVVDTRTGQILALVSKPAFDPNVMTGHLTRAEEAQLEADPHKPFLDKTLRQHYYPGSTYKFVAAIAALEEGLVTPSDRVTCHGWHELGRRTFRCTKAHGSVDLVEAMTQSCNVYFWHLAERAGIDRMARVARDFGFGAPTGLGLNGDVPGRVPFRSWYERAGGFRIGFTLNTAIGQGDTEVTVLQLALAYAAIANGGNLWVPQIVDRVETASGGIVARYPPKLRRRLQASDATLAWVRRGLWGVVNDPKGTGHAAKVDGISVAGKTGTAQVRKLQAQPRAGWHPYRDHAWFAAYAPADAPEISVVVLVEHGGKGGMVAAPVAIEVIRAYFKLKGQAAAGDAVVAAGDAASPGAPPSAGPGGADGAGADAAPGAPASPWGAIARPPVPAATLPPSRPGDEGAGAP